MPPRHRDRARVLICLTLACACAAAPSRAADPLGDLASELKKIGSVRLEGRRKVPARAIWDALKTRKPSPWPWSDRPTLRLDFLRADVEAIAFVYRQHGYLDAYADYRIGSTEDPNRVNVVFEIHEGERSEIDTVNFDGVRSVAEADVRKTLLARPGRPFNPGYLAADTSRISRFYQDKGFLPHVSAEAWRESLDVTVRYDVHEGREYRFGEVYVTTPGESHVNQKLILRELLVREGEQFRRTRIEESQERLYETGLFSAVQVTPLPDSTHSRIDVHLQVRERRPRWIDAGVGSGTAERFRFTGEWGHRNLLGRGLQGVLGARLALDNRGRFLLSRGEASVLEPWLFNIRLRGLASVYIERREDRADPRWLVTQDARGVKFEARHELGRRGEIVLTQDNEFIDQEIDFISGSVADSTRDSLTLNVPPHYTTHRLRLTALREYRDNPLSPTRGSVQSVSGEVAGGPLKGTSSFNKWYALSAWYTPMRRGWVLALRAQGGAIHPFGEGPPFSPDAGIDDQVERVPLEDRFRIGGVNSVRGYDENTIPPSGGLAVLLMNAEVRVPVIGPFGVEGFVDAGNVWARPEYVTWDAFTPDFGETLGPNDLRVAFGVGARVNLPFGPLRLDFAWSTRPDERGAYLRGRPQFAIGPSF